MATKSGPVATKTKTRSKMSPKERMAYYKSLPLWNVIEREIEELIANRDLELTTAQDIVVGSIIGAIESTSTKR